MNVKWKELYLQRQYLKMISSNPSSLHVLDGSSLLPLGIRMLQFSPTRIRIHPRSLAPQTTLDATPESPTPAPKSARTLSDVATRPEPGAPPCSSEP